MSGFEGGPYRGAQAPSSPAGSGYDYQRQKRMMQLMQQRMAGLNRGRPPGAWRGHGSLGRLPVGGGASGFAPKFGLRGNSASPTNAIGVLEALRAGQIPASMRNNPGIGDPRGNSDLTNALNSFNGYVADGPQPINNPNDVQPLPPNVPRYNGLVELPTYTATQGTVGLNEGDYGRLKNYLIGLV